MNYIYLYKHSDTEAQRFFLFDTLCLCASVFELYKN